MIKIEERIWCSPTKSYLRPLPARLGVKPRGRSRRLDRVLTDFGCEHSFARAAESLREHYGVELGASSVRAATLEHAQRARRQMQEEYQGSFRVLPARGTPYVIAQADGTMIRTVGPGARQGKRPREWKEMRLVAAQAKDATSAVYGATFGSVQETGRRWGTAPVWQAGAPTVPSMFWEMGPSGFVCKVRRCFRTKAISCVIFITSANTWERRRNDVGEGPPRGW